MTAVPADAPPGPSSGGVEPAGGHEPWRWRSSPVWARVALAAILLVHATLVVGAVRARGNLWHDEAVTTLGATGHLDDWHRLEAEHALPYGEWATAEAYRDLQAVDHPFDFLEISRGFGETDVHSPAYFWLFHVGVLAGLPLLWAGPVLNILLAGLIASSMVRLVTRLSGSLVAALAAAAATLWSPAFVLAAGEGRLYILSSLFALALGEGCVAAISDVRRGGSIGSRTLVLIGGALAGGLLTQPQFFLFGLAAGAVVGLALLRRGRQVVRAAAAFVSGTVAAIVVFPWFFEQAGRIGDLQGGLEPGQVAGLASRWLTRAFDVVSHHFDEESLARIFMRLLVVGIVAGVIIGWPRWRRWASARPLASLFMGYAGLAAAVSASAYALQFIPAFAVGGHYIVPLWSIVMPSVAIASASMLPRPGPRLVGLAAVGLLASSMVWLGDAAPSGAETRRLLSQVAAGDAVVTNCASRGYFPTVSHVLDPETPVFLATGEDLVAAIRAGWQAPAGTVHLLDAPCPGEAEVVPTLEQAGYGPLAPIGTLERYTVWRFTSP